MELFLQGAAHLFTDPVGLMIFFGGLLGGMLFGAIPGVNMLTLGAVILPFTAGMAPTHAIMLYSVIYCSGVFGGAITAILFNIPGSPENAPTCFDGYPMAQKGQAGKAVGAAIICSSAGGVCSAVLMMVATPLVASWAVQVFGPPELFALICFGLSVAASVGAANIWKGWLSVLFGLLIATIGSDPADGIARFNFGTYYLLAGIHFIPVILGLFAVSEVLMQSQNIMMSAAKGGRFGLAFPSFVEFWRLRITVLRSIVLGIFSGILPGIGATLAAFLSYGEAVRWSRHPERFGKGELAGVVASETANNAATGAAMIPLLALGLPGGALTAMMMGVFQIHGMEPGPLVFITSSDLVWVTFAAMFFANLFILALGWLQTKTVVHLLRVPFRLLAPAILLIATIGAFSLRNLVVDIWVMLLFGVLGFLMRKSGYSAAGVVLGLILGGIGESAFTKSMQLMNYDVLAMFQRPLAAGLLILAIVTVSYNVYKGVREALRPPSGADRDGTAAC